MNPTKDLIDIYLDRYQISISYLFKKNIKKIDYQQFLILLQQELLKQSIKDSCIEDQFLDLFYLTNQFVKKQRLILKSNIKYICPGCAFLGKQSILSEGSYLQCNNCKQWLVHCQDTKLIQLHQTFYKHNKSGFKCKDCNRFIPTSTANKIICPYLDCCFIGDAKNLKKMKHPIIEQNQVETDSILITPVNNPTNIIKNIIEEQSNQLAFSKNNYTVPHKLFVYQAIKQLLDLYPEKMTNYLVNNSRSGGFQHKIFQTYINILEKSLPLVVKKKRKFITISNLLDNNLCLFEGISTFHTTVENNLIYNKTEEYYIGGRKASYVKPYYIGKLIGLVNNKTNQSILHLVQEYSFNKIIVKGLEDNTPVTVTHLRVPPHYQMGGMVYVNRIKKLIADEANQYDKKN